eukprot:TRINITY_DN8759_c0_g1_i1.p1 TRINITY_DN8759_c0_g1~~TRINITY_DN8759_c0_g1_i1.p1  ORF type:complete len:287 (+),score=18.79 TRINITY_DN8759_c0_g1_i1:184-1044(+)
MPIPEFFVLLLLCLATTAVHLEGAQNAKSALIRDESSQRTHEAQKTSVMSGRGSPISQAAVSWDGGTLLEADQSLKVLSSTSVPKTKVISCRDTVRDVLKGKPLWCFTHAAGFINQFYNSNEKPCGGYFYCMDQAKYIPFKKDDIKCKDVTWLNHDADSKEHTKKCPEGHWISGVYFGAGDSMTSWTKSKCCRPKQAPQKFTGCKVIKRDSTKGHGWGQWEGCPKGHAMTGFKIFAIPRARVFTHVREWHCCPFDKNKMASSTSRIYSHEPLVVLTTWFIVLYSWN